MRLKDLERDEAFAWEVLKKAPYATLAMTGADGAPYCVPINHVAAYDSAVVRGQAQVVTDDGERTKALLLLVESLDPKGMGGLAAYMERCFAATQVVKIVPSQITGKQSHPSPKPTFGCGEH